MVRAAFIDKDGLTKGEWSEEEDQKLRACVQKYGHLNWRLVPKWAGLNRCGKSCRLRWVNYLKPDVKRGNYLMQERDLIKRLHDEHGNKWSTIAKSFPGRTDNEIKNYWHTHFNKERRRSGNKKSGHRNNQTKSVQDKTSSESLIAEQWMDFTNSSETSSHPNTCLMKQEKSEIESSTDVYIFDSSSSSPNSGVSVHAAAAAAAAAVDFDFESIMDQELSGMLLQPLDVVVDCKNFGVSDDGAGSSPAASSFSGFQEPYVKDGAYEESGFSFYDDCGFYLDQILGFEDDNDMKLF